MMLSEFIKGRCHFDYSLVPKLNKYQCLLLKFVVPSTPLWYVSPVTSHNEDKPVCDIWDGLLKIWY